MGAYRRVDLSPRSSVPTVYTRAAVSYIEEISVN